MKMRQRKKGAGAGVNVLQRGQRMEASSIDKDARTAEFVGATETPVPLWDDLVEVLRMDGVDLTRFETNAPLFDSHWYSVESLLGRVVETRSEGRTIVFKVWFGEHAQGQAAWERVLDGSLRTVSIGYMVRKWREIGAGETDGEGDGLVRGPAIIGEEWELLELSMAPLPADPNAAIVDKRGFYRDATQPTKPTPAEPARRRSKMSKPTAAQRAALMLAWMKTRGATLGATLDELVAGMVTDETPREDVLAGAADAAGVDADTVEQIVAGDLDCPEMEQLEGLATFFDVPVTDLVEAAESDGCSYDDEEDEPEVEEERAACVCKAAAPKKKRGRPTLAMRIRSLARAPHLNDLGEQLILEGVTFKAARKRLLARHREHMAAVGPDDPPQTETDGEEGAQERSLASLFGVK